jgi:hypothetical protein
MPQHKRGRVTRLGPQGGRARLQRTRGSGLVQEPDRFPSPDLASFLDLPLLSCHLHKFVLRHSPLSDHGPSSGVLRLLATALPLDQMHSTELSPKLVHRVTKWGFEVVLACCVNAFLVPRAGTYWTGLQFTFLPH